MIKTLNWSFLFNRFSKKKKCFTKKNQLKIFFFKPGFLLMRNYFFLISFFFQPTWRWKNKHIKNNGPVNKTIFFLMKNVPQKTCSPQVIEKFPSQLGKGVNIQMDSFLRDVLFDRSFWSKSWLDFLKIFDKKKVCEKKYIIRVQIEESAPDNATK